MNILRFCLTVIFLLPFLGVVNFGLIYVAYAFCIITLSRLMKGVAVPIILFVKIFVLLALVLVYVNDASSRTNLLGLLLGDLFIFIIGYVMVVSGSERSVFELLKMYIYIVVFGFVFSTVFADRLELANPLQDLFDGQRLRVLNRGDAGHSVLVDISALILSCSLVGYFSSGFWRVAAIFLSVILLLLSKTFVAMLLLVMIFVSVGVELLRIGGLSKALLHISLISMLSVSIVNPLAVNELMRHVRSEYLNQDERMYDGDYSSGRAPLNELMLITANESPFYGVGNDDPVLRLGLNVFGAERKLANSESTLRLAAKYGYIYFLSALLFFVSPLFAIFSQKVLVRKLFIPIGYVTTILALNGSAFEVAHSYSYYIVGVFSVVYLLTVDGVCCVNKEFLENDSRVMYGRF